MSHPKVRTRYAEEDDGSIHEVGDFIEYGGNAGRVVEVSDTGMITVKSSDQVMVLDPANVHIWNQRLAYKQLVSGTGEDLGDMYVRKDELLAFILTRMAHYNKERASGSTENIFSQIYYDLLNYLKTKNTKESAEYIKDSL